VFGYSIQRVTVIAEYSRQSTLSRKEAARRSCGPRRTAHGGYAAVVAVRQFLQRSALRAPSGGLFLLRRGPSHVLSLELSAVPAFGGAGADEIALHVSKASEYGQHQPPGTGAGVGPRLRQGSKLRLGVHDAEQVEGAARKPVDPRHLRAYPMSRFSRCVSTVTYGNSNSLKSWAQDFCRYS
jgi:hypothetical protein